MKLLTYIIGFGLVCVLAGLLVLRYFGWSEAGTVSPEQFETLLRELIRDEEAKFRVESYFNLPDKDQERLSLERFLPDASYSRREIAALARFSETCDFQYFHATRDLKLRKALLFHELLCKDATPPEGFFENAPYIHPLGRSFVARAHQLNPQKFDLVWLQSKKNFLHILELNQVFPGDDAGFGPIARLDREQRRSWVRGTPITVMGNHLWMLTGHADERMPADAHYLAFDLSSINASLHRRGLEIVGRATSISCLIYQQGFCVRSDSLGASARFWALRVITVSAGIVAICLLTLLVSWSISRSRARKERMMILQTLAHELRTPVTSLGISLELLRGEFERLSESGQTSYLRIADDVRRLKRLIDGSRSYLTADSKERYAKESIELDAFLQRFAEGYDGNVTYKTPTKAVTVYSHPYWLNICLANLVENALNHGKPEVQLSVTERAGSPCIIVEDGGSFSKKEFLRLRGEFARGSTSRGMGLGLTIVAETLHKLGHQFDFTEAPTRFLITIKGS